jgi:hypothetical protein
VRRYWNKHAGRVGTQRGGWLKILLTESGDCLGSDQDEAVGFAAPFDVADAVA